VEAADHTDYTDCIGKTGADSGCSAVAGLRPHDSSHHLEADTGWNGSRPALRTSRLASRASARERSHDDLTRRNTKRQGVYREGRGAVCPRGRAARGGRRRDGRVRATGRSTVARTRTSLTPSRGPAERPAPADTRVAAASSVVVAATFVRTFSSTTHHAGALRLIRAVRAVRGSRSFWRAMRGRERLECALRYLRCLRCFVFEIR
jgi:hypothetical protein